MAKLKLDNVSKQVKSKTLIDNISFDIQSGEIFGLIGENGAGKTTLIRMITGMIKPTSGTVYINGHSVEKEFKTAIKDVSAIVETPIFYDYLSGTKHLIQRARNLNIKISQDEIEEIAEIIGLKTRLNEKVGRYSLGMKQRLAIGLALVGNPNFIILDEPLNGLDPSGIIEIRKLILKLSKTLGRTVLISSHLLNELELIVDRGVIIQNGRLRHTFDMSNKETNLGEQITISVIGSVEVLKNLDYEFHTVKENEHLIFLEKDVEHLQHVLKDLIENNVKVVGIGNKKQTLEDTYLSVLESGE